MDELETLERAGRALLTADLEQIEDAPTLVDRVETATVGDEHPHLEVWGWTAPQIRFVLRVPPASTWNGRFLFLGNGGPGGVTEAEATEYGLAQGYAIATCDTGHAATGLASLWAWQNPDAVRDYAWRSVHAASLSAHAIIERLHGRPATRSYFAGRSTGGRQGLIEAQRFPQDFDGVLVSNSGHDFFYSTFTWPWLAQQVFTADGTPVLSPDDIETASRSVLAQAEVAGGVEDGVIVRPWLVDVDVDAIPVGPRQRTALHALYHGPAQQPSARGFPGYFAGSETAGDWQTLFTGPSLVYAIARTLVRYQIYDKPLGPHAGVGDWSPEHWPQAFERTTAENTATSPDLDGFRARGGKLLMTQSWGDGWIDPRHAIDYQQDVVDRYGEVDAASTMRLFMVPGSGHTAGLIHYGHTADSLDLLARWVEEDRAPEELVVDGRRLTPWQGGL